MNNPPERLAWPQRLSAFKWDTPWAWPLTQQVGALTVLVLVLLMACVASLSPWWAVATFGIGWPLVARRKWT